MPDEIPATSASDLAMFPSSGFGGPVDSPPIAYRFAGGPPE
jgi:hypothetical protein